MIRGVLWRATLAVWIGLAVAYFVAVVSVGGSCPA